MTKGLVALVESKTPITDLIGSGANCRFYPRMLPQGLSTFPAGAYRVVSNSDNPTFDSPSKLDHAMIDIQWYARNYDDVVEIWETSRKELEYEIGTFNGVAIKDVEYMDSGQEDYLEELRLYTKLLELRITYTRTP